MARLNLRPIPGAKVGTLRLRSGPALRNPTLRGIYFRDLGRPAICADREEAMRFASLIEPKICSGNTRREVRTWG